MHRTALIWLEMPDLIPRSTCNKANRILPLTSTILICVMWRRRIDLVLVPTWSLRPTYSVWQKVSRLIVGPITCVTKSFLTYSDPRRLVNQIHKNISKSNGQLSRHRVAMPFQVHTNACRLLHEQRDQWWTTDQTCQTIVQIPIRLHKVIILVLTFSSTHLTTICHTTRSDWDIGKLYKSYYETFQHLDVKVKKTDGISNEICLLREDFGNKSNAHEAYQKIVSMYSDQIRMLQSTCNRGRLLETNKMVLFQQLLYHGYEPKV